MDGLCEGFEGGREGNITHRYKDDVTCNSGEKALFYEGGELGDALFKFKFEFKFEMREVETNTGGRAVVCDEEE